MTADFIEARLLEYKNRWTVRYYLKGKKIDIRVEKHRKNRTTRQARAYIQSAVVQKINRQLYNGIDPRREARECNTITVSALIDKFIENCINEGKKDNTIFSYQSILTMGKNDAKTTTKNCKPTEIQKKCGWFYKMNVAEITRQDAMRFFSDFSKGISNKTARTRLDIFKALFSYAIREEIINETPFRNFPKIKQDEQKIRVWTESEKQTILEYTKEHDFNFHTFIKIEMGGLMRPCEIFRCKIKDINFTDRIIKVPAENAKNGKTRHCIIPTSMYDIFDEWVNRNNLLNFSNKNTYVFGKNLLPSEKECTSELTSYRFAQLRKKLNLPKDCVLYSGRHTGITTMLADPNISNNTVRVQAGHTDLKMTSHYSNFLIEESKEQLRNANI